jgi:hypothetical protein
MLRVSPDVKAEVARLKGEYETASGQILSINDALEILLQERKHRAPFKEDTLRR